MRILITGGSGLIGNKLTEILIKSGHEVGWLTRKKQDIENVLTFKWDIEIGFLDPESLKWADVIVHLAGSGIAEKRWTKKRKQEIISSRTKTTELLYRTLKNTPHKIQKIVCASAIGYYGKKKELQFETDLPGNDFLSKSCIAWENATTQLKHIVPHLVTIRIGIVLSNLGGAYPEMTKTKRIGILPILGNGKQIYSWIHIQDVCNLLLFTIEQVQVNGVYNAVAPNPVTQKKMIYMISKKLNSFSLCFPVPEWILQVILGEMKTTVLNSQNISAKKILDAGFQFTFSEIDEALTDIIKKV